MEINCQILTISILVVNICDFSSSSIRQEKDMINRSFPVIFSTDNSLSKNRIILLLLSIEFFPIEIIDQSTHLIRIRKSDIMFLKKFSRYFCIMTKYDGISVCTRFQWSII